MGSSDAEPSANASELNGGEMARRVHEADWGSTALGAADSWPAQLSTLVQVILGSNEPMFVVWGPERTLIYNDAYAGVLATKHPVLGRDILVVWSEIRADLEPLVAKAYAGEPTRGENLELVMERKGFSELTHWSYSYTPVRLDDGSVGGFLCACHEISERVIATRRLAESEARHRGVLANMDAAFALLDADFNMLEVNEPTCRLVGMNRESLIGRNHWECFPGTFDSELGRLYRRVLADGVPESLEHSYAFEDGRKRWLEVRAFPVQPGIAVLFRDVTQRRSFYERAALAAERLELAMDVAQVGAWQWDIETGEVVADHRCREMCGLEGETGELRYSQLRQRLHPDDRQRVEHTLQQTLRAGAHPRYAEEWRWLHPNGRIVWTASRGVLLQGSEAGASGPVRMIGSLLDITERKAAEAVLQESEARLSLAMDVGGLASWETDLSTGRNRWDARMAGLLGVRPSDASAPSGHWLDFVHPEDRERVATAFGAAVAGGGRYQSEFRSVRADGSVRWLSSCGELVVDADRMNARMVGVVQDVTDRKRVELQLSEERAVLNAVLAAAPVGFALFDRDLRFLIVNEQLADMNGLPAAAHLGRKVSEVVPGLASQVRQVVDQVIATGRPVLGHEVSGTTAKEPGTLRHWAESWYPVLAADGHLLGVAAMVEEITERKAKEAALRESHARLEATYSNAPIGIVETTVGARLIRVNDAFCQLLGRTQADVRTRPLLDFVHPDDRDSERRDVDDLLAGRDARGRHETRYVHADGSAVWVEVQRTLIRDDDGHPVTVVGAIVDLRERKRLESERDNHLAALRDADRRKDEFLATLAHELRNPLAPIRNALHLLNMTGGTMPAERILEMLDRQVGHLVRLVDDLMEASRISRGKLELQPEALDLRDVLRSSIEACRPSIDKLRHRLEILLPGEPLPVSGDPVRLGQIFVNLLNNAAKYTDEGGRIEVVAQARGNRAVVSVRDNGVGIAEEHWPKVFEMFAQIDSSASRRHGGLGIGLALAKRLAEMHGGGIEVASEGSGKGSTFTVHLPLNTDSATVQPHTGSLPVLGARRMMIVDDNQDAADSLGLLLRFLGAEVLVEYSGAAALATAETWRPSVVLLDLGMPQMDGFEVARRLRADPAFADLKLIALTGWGQEEDRRRTRAGGFDDHLIKPVDLNVLHALLASLNTEASKRP